MLLRFDRTMEELKKKYIFFRVFFKFLVYFFSVYGLNFFIIIFFFFNFSGQGNIVDVVLYFCLNSIASGGLVASLGLAQHVTETADYTDFGNFFFLNPSITQVPES